MRSRGLPVDCMPVRVPKGRHGTSNRRRMHTRPKYIQRREGAPWGEQAYVCLACGLLYTFPDRRKRSSAAAWVEAWLSSIILRRKTARRRRCHLELAIAVLVSSIHVFPFAFAFVICSLHHFHTHYATSNSLARVARPPSPHRPSQSSCSFHIAMDALIRE